MVSVDVSQTGSMCLVVIPTYCECDSILKVQEGIRAQGLRYELLVVDDGSDDGTFETLRGLQAKGQPVIVFEREKKLGLGSAYVLAYAYACESNYSHVAQMDADLSHDPGYLPRMLMACRNCDVVIGSRYVPGGGCDGWPWYRLGLSWMANRIARWILRLKIRDATGGFKCLRKEFLRNLALSEITSQGFSFQWELNYRAQRQRARFMEIPICFRQRRAGTSKMSLQIMAEGLIQLLRMRCPFGRGRTLQKSFNGQENQPVATGRENEA